MPIAAFARAATAKRAPTTVSGSSCSRTWSSTAVGAGRDPSHCFGEQAHSSSRRPKAAVLGNRSLAVRSSGSLDDRKWPIVPGFECPSASNDAIRPPTNVGHRRPRVKPGPAPDDTSQRGTEWRLGTTARSRTSSREELWLAPADDASAWPESGAGDGNRTHVRRPAPLAGSITYTRR